MTKSLPTAGEPADPAACIAGDLPTKTVALVLDTALAASIEIVWRALTDPALVARWLLPGGMADKAGEAFSLDGAARLGGRIDCTVIDSRPPRHLSYLWRQEGARPDDPALETTVRFDLKPLAEGGTRLRLVHEGFVVAADRPVDAVAEGEEAVVVLLPVAALWRRRSRRPVPAAQFRRGALPLTMRLAA